MAVQAPRRLFSSGWFLRAALRAAIAVEVIVIVAVLALYTVIAVNNIVSWPANRVLISDSYSARLFVATALAAGCALVSNMLLYGRTGEAGPGRVLGATMWTVLRRPSRAKLTPSMRLPPAWMWLLLAITAAGSVAVVAGSAAAGMGKGELRVLSGPVYEVSTLNFNGAWIVVSHARYQAYAADFARLDSVNLLLLSVVIACVCYPLYLHRELLRSSRLNALQPAPS